MGLRLRHLAVMRECQSRKHPPVHFQFSAPQPRPDAVHAQLWLLKIRQTNGKIGLSSRNGLDQFPATRVALAGRSPLACAAYPSLDVTIAVRAEDAADMPDVAAHGPGAGLRLHLWRCRRAGRC